MTSDRSCPDCGAPLLQEARRGVCPNCFARQALSSVEHPGESDPPGVGLWLLNDSAEARDFGDYELFEEIGHGGMGIIYKACQRSLDRIVAIKLIRSGSLARPEDIARFHTEAAAAARLQHPHIVAIYEVGEHENQYFYSMEFVPGRSLAERLRQGPLAPREAARLLKTVAEAIHFAHQRGVLHRDLKPSNILLDAQGEPRVADFGLAKMLHADSEMTLSGAVLGSPQYMAPEQARGRSARAGVGSDIYSLGAIFYELLTGRPPLSAATPLETLKLVVDEEPIAPRSLNRALPKDLETICLKCLAKEPRSRYLSAQDLADDLDHFLRNEPIRARAVSPWERGWRWCRRQPALAALGALLVLSPAVIITVLLAMDTRIAREHQRTRQNLYASDMSLALISLEHGDYAGAHKILQAHIPAGGAPDLRGFEWRYLAQRARGDARKSVTAHFAQVESIAYSPNGRWVASGGWDGREILWDATNETPLRMLTDAPEVWAQPGQSPPMRRYSAMADNQPRNLAVRSASFSSDNRWLLLGKPVGNQIWDPATGELLGSLEDTGVPFATFSPTNNHLVLAGNIVPPGLLYLDEAPSGRTLNVWSNNIHAFCLSPDGQWSAVWSRDDYMLRILSIPEGHCRNQWSTGRSYVYRMAFAPNGSVLAVGDYHTGAVNLYEPITGALRGRLEGPNGRIVSLAFSPNGRLLATGHFDQAIRLWDVATQREVRRLHGHSSAVLCLAFSPDGRTLASGGYDGTVSFWDVSAPAAPPALTNVSRMFAFSRDGRRLLTQHADGHLVLWELPSRSQLQVWTAPRCEDAIFLQDDRFVSASLGDTNSVPSLRGYRAGESEVQRLVALRGVESPCSAIALAPDGSLCVSGHQDGTVAFWDPVSGRLLSAAWQVHHVNSAPSQSPKVLRITFSANSQTLASAGFDILCLKTWSARQRRELGSRRFLDRYDLVPALSPDGREIALGGPGQGLLVNLWTTDLKTLTRQFAGHDDFLHGIAYSPDGRTLATGGVDGLLKLWHLPTNREIGTMATFEHRVEFQKFAFSPDGSWLGVLAANGTLHLWHAPSLTELDRTR